MKSWLPFMCLSFIMLGSQTINATAFYPAKKSSSFLANGPYHLVSQYPEPTIKQKSFPEPQFNPKKYPEPQIKPHHPHNKKEFPGEDWKQKPNKKEFPGDDWRNGKNKSVR